MTRPHRILILGFPPAQMLDITGPLDVFSVANDIVQGEGLPRPYVVTLGGPEAGPLATTSGIPLLASCCFYSRGLRVDTLMLAGGPGARLAAKDPRMMAAVGALIQRADRVGSICTGAFPLAASGVLEGQRATTHWAHFDEFAGIFPGVSIDRDALYVGKGKFRTSAGISAGIDFSLALIEEDLGRRIALAVARELVVFMKRPGGQSQFSSHLTAETGAEDPDRFRDLIRWMAEHPAANLSVEALAEREAMSPRNFARRFVEAMKVTPGQYVQQLRLDTARRLLTDTTWSVARVADRCGFPSAEAMRLTFLRLLKVTPSDFRARFQSTGVHHLK